MIAGLLALPVAVLADGHGFDPDEPPPEGKGSVYGTVTARPHKDYVLSLIHISEPTRPY